MTQAQLETLMVRLVGDTTQYVQQMADAQRANDAFDAATKRAVANMVEYKRRMDLGWTGRRVEDAGNFLTSGNNQVMAAKALGTAYVAFHAIQTAVNGSQEEFNRTLQDGANLASRLSEMMSYRVTESTQNREHLLLEDKKKSIETELAGLQKIAEGQRKNRESLRDSLKEGFFGHIGKGAVRSIPGVGEGFKDDIKLVEEQMKGVDTALEVTRKQVLALQREFDKLGEAGNKATQQLLQELKKEDEQLQMTTDQRRVYVLALKGATEAQQQEITEVLRANKAKADAIKENQRIQEAIYAEEDSRKSRAKSLEDSLSTNNPFDKYKAEVKELNELFKEGLLGPTIYLRGIQQASNSLDRATQSAARFKEVNSSLFGSFQGQQEFKSYLESLSPQTNNPNAFPIPSLPSGRIEGFGNGEAALKVLNEIKDALKKDNEPKVVVRPANVGGG